MAKAAEQAYAKIREGILNGVFKPGQHLKEAELVEFCGVSRTPVRTALHRLAAEDFVDAERNQGARVRAWSDADVDELFALRALVEGFAAGRAAVRINDSELQTIHAAIQEMDQVLNKRGKIAEKTAEFLRLNSLIHGTIWSATGSVRLVNMLSSLVDQSLQIRTANAYDLERIEQSHRQHQELLEALKARDQVWAEAIMRSHIRAARYTLP